MFNLLLIQDDNERFEKLQKIKFNKSCEYYNKIAELAANICNTPIGLITIVDKESQRFLGKFGVDYDRTSLNDSICKYTLSSEQHEHLILNNLMDIPELTDNKLIHNDPKIKFYCGIPFISSDNVNIGAICAIDIIPRELTDSQIKQLQLLTAILAKDLNSSQ